MRVLIIEDNPNHLKLLNKLVTSIKNVQSVTAHDGLDGFAILKAVDDIDLIIVDQNMPFIKGTEFIAKVRSSKVFADIPIIMSTAEPESEQGKFLDAGANAIFHKPFDIKSFTGILEELNFALA